MANQVLPAILKVDLQKLVLNSFVTPFNNYNMKKIITSLALSLLVCGVFAQSIPTKRLVGAPVIGDMQMVQPKKASVANKTAANDTFTVAHWLGAQDTSGRYMWDFNWNYSNEDELKWALTWFDTLHDSYGNTKAYSASKNTIVDSIFVLCGHKKTSSSSVTDSITFELFDLDAVPTPAYVWDTVITTTTSLSTSNNWLQSKLLAIPCKYKLDPNHRFAIRVGFAGPVIDTFGIVVGFKNAGACGTTSTVSATLSDIPFNTYRMYAKLDTSFTSTPMYATDFVYPSNIWNGVFFRDCNANGSYDSGSNEEEVFQSAYIFCDVILADVIISVSEGALTSGLSVFPNPSNGSFTVNMDLGTAVDMNISVTDLQGKEVYTESISNTSNFSRNLDLTHLNKGVYIFRATTETGSAVQKIVIN